MIGPFVELYSLVGNCRHGLWHLWVRRFGSRFLQQMDSCSDKKFFYDITSAVSGVFCHRKHSYITSRCAGLLHYCSRSSED